MIFFINYVFKLNFDRAIPKFNNTAPWMHVTITISS